MTDPNVTVVRWSRLTIMGMWVGVIASVGGLVAMVLIAIDKVVAGHGLEPYRTKWLIEDNWIGFLVFVVVAALVVVAAAIIGCFQRRREQREIQQLQTKYSAGHDG